MANTPLRIVAKVTQGLLSPQARQAILSYLKGHDGKNVVIEAKRYHKKRSLSQNAFYWGVVVPFVSSIFAEHGEILDAEEVHAYLKEHVGKMSRVVLQPDGSRVRVVRSSKELTTAEWEEYIKIISIWCGSNGFMLPSPNEHLNPPIL